MNFRLVTAGAIAAAGTALYAIPIRLDGSYSLWQFALSVVSNPLYQTYFVLPAWLVYATFTSRLLTLDTYLLAAGSSNALMRQRFGRAVVVVVSASFVVTLTLLAMGIGLSSANRIDRALPWEGAMSLSFALLAQLGTTAVSLFAIAAVVGALTRVSERALPAVAFAVTVWIWMAASTIGLMPSWMRLNRLFDPETPLLSLGLVTFAIIANVLIGWVRDRDRSRT